MAAKKDDLKMIDKNRTRVNSVRPFLFRTSFRPPHRRRPAADGRSAFFGTEENLVTGYIHQYFWLTIREAEWCSSDVLMYIFIYIFTKNEVNASHFRMGLHQKC
jgi:hypothetical protein